MIVSNTKPRVLALTHCDITEACTFARLVMPLHELGSSGRITYELVTVSPRRIATVRHVLDTLSEWDVIWVQRPHHYIMLPIIHKAKALGKPVLVDLDDWLLTLPSELSSTAFTTRAVRETLRTVLYAANAVTVSTPVIAERCAALGLRTHVLPNAIDCTQFTNQPRDAKAPLTIGFCGSLSHRDDVRLVAGALYRLLKERPRSLAVVTVGCPIPELDGLDNYTHYASVPATEYPHLLSNLRIDVGLAPLWKTSFTEAKSDIKYLEYSAIGAVTVASPVTPYVNSVEKTRGILVHANTPEAWIDAISQVVARDDERLNLALNAYHWVRNERSLAATVDRWAILFREYTNENTTPLAPDAQIWQRGCFERVLANNMLRHLRYDAQQFGQLLLHGIGL